MVFDSLLGVLGSVWLETSVASHTSMASHTSVGEKLDAKLWQKLATKLSL